MCQGFVVVCDVEILLIDNSKQSFSFLFVCNLVPWLIGGSLGGGWVPTKLSPS